MAETPTQLTARLGLTVTGWEALTPNVLKWGEAAATGLGAALYEIAENIIGKAKRLTPVDTGNLKASGHVAKPVRSGTVVRVELGFGGPAGVGNQGGETNQQAVGYAFYVHENLTASHLKRNRSGKMVQSGRAKYLEIPMTEAQRGFESELIRRAGTILRERGLLR